MTNRSGILSLFIFSLLQGMVSCGDKGTPSAMSQLKDYPVLVISTRATTLYTDFPASIEGQQNVEIRPKIDGYVDRIYVDEGAAVRKGQLLFRIFAPQYEEGVRTAQANIKIAEADVNAAEMNVNKVKPLVEKNIISRYELESAEYTLQSRRAALAQANANLANARTNLGYTEVTSPVNGIIGLLPFKIGSLVSSTTAQPLTTVSNTGNIYAYFSVNEKQDLAFSQRTGGTSSAERLARIPPVSLVLADGTVYPEKGRVVATGGTVNTQTGALSVRATFPNPRGLIRSGSSGVVRIPVTVDSAILVPQKSTYEIQGKKFVYLLSDSGTVQSTEIDIRENSGGKFYVVSAGLRPGDRIVLEGVATLREGLKIKPVAASTDSVYARLNQ